MSDSSDLRAKIDRAKQLLVLPDLMRRLGYDEKHLGKTAYYPFHPESTNRFRFSKAKMGKAGSGNVLLDAETEMKSLFS